MRKPICTALPLVLALLVCTLNTTLGIAQPVSENQQAEAAGAPIRLRQPIAEPRAATAPETQATADAPSAAPSEPVRRPLERQGRSSNAQFEDYVGLPRFGEEMVMGPAGGSGEFTPVVPPEYIIQSGDEIQVAIWGSVDADLRLVVDRSGRLVIPRVGPVMVSGLRYDELAKVLTRRVAQVFRNFELSASLGRLRGVRVYVTGFVAQPGAHVVPGLSSVLNALMRAGGPSHSGSFRNIELRRGGKLVSELDLYNILLKGDRSADQVVQPDDVIHVGVVGAQVGLAGSVHKPAVYELLQNETLRELLVMSGGFNSVAERSRVTLERLADRREHRVVELELPSAIQTKLAAGDVVRAHSKIDYFLSQQQQNKLVRVEGEVVKPGDYLLPPGSTLSDALRAAGGPREKAYLAGTHFMRESVRVTQQQNYERALRDLETEIARAAGTSRVATADEAQAAAIRAQSNSRLVERLRATKPTGRVVLQLDRDAKQLPDLLVEDQDRIYIPHQSATVGVFGSVFNGGNYLFNDGRRLEDYLRLAGGMTKGADESSAFVVRANGTVESARQLKRGWLTGASIGGLVAEAGDTIFVPEELDKVSITQTIKDWTQVIYQLGIGLAAFQVATGR